MRLPVAEREKKRMKDLKEKGLNYSEIGRKINRNESVVRYHLIDNHRKKKILQNIESNKNNKYLTIELKIPRKYIKSIK